MRSYFTAGCFLLQLVLLTNSERSGPPASYSVFLQHGDSPRVTFGSHDSHFSFGDPNSLSFGHQPFAPISAQPQAVSYGPPPPGPQPQQVLLNNQPILPPQLPQLPAVQPTVDPSTLGCGMAPASCPPNRYRSLDGTCNNLKNPILGSPQTPYNRLLPQKYGDGVSTPPTALSGNQLPSARVVSLVLYPDVPIEDPKWTLANMQYGQIITHDMSMIAGSTQSKPHQTRCCTDDGQLLELANSPEHCFPIILPDDDPVNAQSNTKCMNFVRTITDRDRRCVGGNQPAEQLTVVNHFLDLSIVYGNSDMDNRNVRAYQGGRLRVDVRNGQQWPPQALNKTAQCDIQSQDEICYQAGDVRANQNSQLTVLQVLLLREHNRIADVLGKLNPHWDDETTYQEARRIAIAEHQFITYYEWLPIFLGTENMLKNKLIYNTKNFVNDYREDVDPTIINEHATAAFRHFHALIAGHLDLVSEHRGSYSNLRISDWFNRPAILEQGNNFDDLTRGMATQPERNSDQFCDSEITQFLFRNGRPFGQDLKSLDVQRNRDHGLASYNDYRGFCGLPKAHTFQDLLDVISPENVNKLVSLYETVDDIDLTVGGSLEARVPGALSGPTFLCILTEQFYRTRVGDRFFFENGDAETGFTIQQLNEIRKSSMARIMCDNSGVKTMQPEAFQRLSDKNQLLDCQALPAVDLSLWQDTTGIEHQSIGYFKK